MTVLDGLSDRTEATYIPGERPALFFWLPPSLGPHQRPDLEGEHEQVRLTIPRKWSRKASDPQLVVAQVGGVSVSLGDVIEGLMTMPLATVDGTSCSRSVAAWSAVAKLALELVVGQHVVPWVEPGDGHERARWRAAMRPEDRRRAEALAKVLPPAGRAWPGLSNRKSGPSFMAPGRAVRSFLDEVVDLLVRDHVSPRSAKAWTARFAVALGSDDHEVVTRTAVEGRLPELVRQWASPGVGENVEAPVRLGLQLGLPEDESDRTWPVTLVAEATIDPSLRTEAGELWRGGTESAKAIASAVPRVHEAFLLELDRACRLWPPLAPCLEKATPDGIELSAEHVVELVGEAAPLLSSAGFKLHIPPELSVSGRRRLRARLRGRSSPGAGEGSGLFGLDKVLTVCWDAALGDEQLSVEELRSLAEAKRPLVRWRDQWLVVDPGELRAILELMERPATKIDGARALRAIVSGEVEMAGGIRQLELDSSDELVGVLNELRAGGRHSVGRVPGLKGALRPYQAVGVAWLGQLGRLGLGACLADDMGLGKTVQIIAYLLLRRDATPSEAPCLLVAPTSVVGNWQRELERFAPGIPAHIHHGPNRLSDRDQLLQAAASAAVVLTTYGTLRSDSALLASIAWDVAVMDEAQFVKNHQSKVARAAFDLNAQHKIALTGTPVENRLTDLWSIFAFINPGLLGGVTSFKKQISTPIERFRDRPALEKLQRLTSPFILRRRKTDPDIASELPPRIVLRSSCSLTKEQASLYQACLDSLMEDVEASEGMDRRGKVLALITALKQVCNHPSQFLREKDSDSDRSGKLLHLAENLDAVFAEGEAALLFTQYRAMGDILVRFLEQRFALEAPFLHGGVSRKKREEMVARFQDDEGPPVMVVSVKAGGTGINLTRASHVIHVDRWWNPAVEAQATDRAHRIGQKRTVVVHALVTAGTLEERIDRMLEEKKELAEVALSGGERWLTELDNDALRELVALDFNATGSDEKEVEATSP